MTLVLVRKFSARNFFPDCAKTGCTIAQYIGELIRYVMMVEPRPSDRQHKIKVVFGNGLRGDIWLEFKRRFGEQSCLFLCYIVVFLLMTFSTQESTKSTSFTEPGNLFSASIRSSSFISHSPPISRSFAL